MRVTNNHPRQVTKSVDLNLLKGDNITVKVAGKQEGGLYLVTIKGTTLQAQLPENLSNGLYRAQVIESEPLQLKIINTAEESANQATLSKGSLSEKSLLTINKGTINATVGEKLNLSILGTLKDGSTLVGIKDNLFKVNIGDILFKSVQATITQTDPAIEMQLNLPSTSNLNSSFVKSMLGGFDIGKLLESMRGLNNLSLSEISAEKLKEAIKNSGLFLERNLLAGDDVTQDQKMQALQSGDKGTSDNFSRLQLASLLLGDSIIGFLNTKDENVDDALYKFQKDQSGTPVLHMSMEFSNIGKTYIRLRPIRDDINILVKTETDISEYLKDLKIDGAILTWGSFADKDIDIFDVKDDLLDDLAGLDIKA